jgi:hypothetical protein
VLAVALLISARAWGANLIPNPSAEAGNQGPDSWVAIPALRGFWQKGGAKFGERCLGLDAVEGPVAWRSAEIAAAALQGYRVSGWIRSGAGKGWVELCLSGPEERLVTLARTPVASSRSWVYVAAEISSKALPPGSKAYLVCRAEKGRCFFDGLRLVPLDSNILPNPELSPRMIEEKPDPAGAPEGWHALPETETRALAVEEIAPGAKAIRLGGSHPVQAASYLVDLPTATRVCGLSARVLTDGLVGCAISWFGAHGRIKDDEFTISGTGQQMEEAAGTGRVPRGANRVRAVFSLVRGHSALVQPTALVAVVGPEPAKVSVFVNQVGYEPESRKRAIVASTEFPRDLRDARFEVVDQSGMKVFGGRLITLGRVHEGRPDDWGAYYWLADFREVRRPGRYRTRATIGNQTATSHPFAVGRGVVFQATAELAYRFLYYQRCGQAVPGWHGACHLDDARLPDGTHLNLAGGWHDAGDCNKWMYPNGPPLVLYGLASAYAAHRESFDRIDHDGNGRADLLDEILWGADWLTRMRNPKTGGLFGSVTTGWSFWGLPERETDNVPGNDDDRPVANEEPPAALAAGALAKAAQCVHDGERFLRAAIELEAYSRKREGNSPDRLLACLAIWQTTGRSEYLEQARACADSLAGLSPGERQERALGALALFVGSVPGARGEARYLRALGRSVSWLSRRQGREPFIVAAGRSGKDDDMQEASRLGGMGTHMTLTSNAWAVLASARAIGSRAALTAAFTELDWLLGLNPLDLCMLQGAGSHNPPRYHHRYFDNPAHRDGAVPGAIPNGIARPNSQPSLDLPFFGWLHRDAMTAEPWIPYTGYYLSALALMDTGR